MRLFAGLLAVLVIASCVTVSRPGPVGLVSPVEARLPGFPANIRFVNPDTATFLTSVRDGVRRAREAAGDGSLDILSLSGGGAGGGFGAGVMKGLSESGRRPQFELVTGVSTGALIAPFAFLGSDWDDRLADAYTSGEAEALTQSFGFASLFRVGLLDSSNLRTLVTKFVTPEMITAIAIENAKGRMLLVATTNLDAEEPVYWNIGEIASHSGEPGAMEKARALIVDILVASSAIPGAIPPVLIPVQHGERSYSEVHVDGGVTVPFFIFPEVAYLSGERMPELAGANIYIVINGQFESVQRPAVVSLIAITLRAFNVHLVRAARSELLLTAALANRHSMNLRFTYIPQSYPFEGAFDFKRQTTKALYDYGAKCAASDRLWLMGADVFDRSTRPPVTAAGSCPSVGIGVP
jgi:predicted acylesterase/phospholipase RssA